MQYRRFRRAMLGRSAKAYKRNCLLGLVAMGLFFMGFYGTGSYYDLQQPVEYIKKTPSLIKLPSLLQSREQWRKNVTNIPKIHIITPTYTRAQQKAELTRLSHTLRHVPNINWILVEDAENRTRLVANFLANCKIKYTHLKAKTPKKFKLKGATQRNAGINWIKKQKNSTGVVYFADDDNTYDLQVFEEMRYTKRVSVWPVGLAGGMQYEAPIVKNGKVIGWKAWNKQRKFAIDMAGFAVNVQRFHELPNAEFHKNASAGYQESMFIQQLATVDDLEPKADNCTKVLVWHTRTERPNLTKVANATVHLDLEV